MPTSDFIRSARAFVELLERETVAPCFGCGLSVHRPATSLVDMLDNKVTYEHTGNPCAAFLELMALASAERVPSTDDEGKHVQDTQQRSP